MLRIENTSLDDIKYQSNLCEEKYDMSYIYNYFIYDQGISKKCIASAIVTALEYLRQIDGKEFKKLSVNYEYFFARHLLHKDDSDVPITFNSAIQTIKNYGGIYENEEKEDMYENIHTGKNNILDNVLVFQLDINKDIFRVKLSIDHTPIIVTIICPKSCYNKKIIDNNITEDNIIISHSVCIVGYDDEKELFKFQNSFGNDWNDNGFGYIKYSALNFIKVAICFNGSCFKGISEITTDIWSNCHELVEMSEKILDI